VDVIELPLESPRVLNVIDFEFAIRGDAVNVSKSIASPPLIDLSAKLRKSGRR
jgi:hypothetical protein